MKNTVFALLLLYILLPAQAQTQILSSPDGRYAITFSGMQYTVTYNNKVIVEKSQLGVDIDNRLFESALAVPRGVHENWCSDLTLESVDSMKSADTTWTPLYGENARIRDHYNEMILHYEKGSNGQGTVNEGYDKRKYYAMDIIVRAYDEGVAFRYHFPETANSLFLHITGEQTSFAFPDGTMAWYEEWAQGPYDKRPLKGDWFESERPLLLQLPSGTYVALLEAAMRDYTRGKFRLKKDNELQVAMYDCADIISPYDTPWRVIMAADRAVDLINHKDLVLNLSPDRDMQTDWSWVKPGKAFRSGKLTKGGIFKSIDYCKEFGFDYVELDAGWYGPEGKVSSDARKVVETRDFTMPEVCQYAKSKGIGVWVYVNQRALYRQLDELLPLYEQWGISGIKFGFVHIGNQQWSTWLHDAIAKCARHHIMVDIHDEYRPTGMSRTFPNLLTQEGIRGNEEMPDATHNVLLPFTRYLCGPADYTLCYFNSRVKNTKGHQLAMAAVYYSPLQFYFWYDNPFVDKGEAELQFWKDCPTVFDESIALDGQPGEYIVQARRAGSEWFGGAMTNTEGRTVSISTDFLPKGKYEVEIYNDDPSLDTRTKVKSETIKLKSPGKPIILQLQPSGGAALHITPLAK
jgi:alpha-glucosidase